MSGNNVALDTNQAIQILNDVPAAVAWLGSFDQLFLPVTVIGELLYGAMNSKRVTENVAKVYALVDRCQSLDTTVETSRAYARLRLDLKAKGRPVPENDLWIAASCVEHHLPLSTNDEHFAEFETLEILRQP